MPDRDSEGGFVYRVVCANGTARREGMQVIA